MGRGPARMPLLIVQEHQRSTAQNFARASNQSARNQLVCIHRLAMPINVDTARRFLLSCLLPQHGGPLPKSVGESLSSFGIGEVGEKSLGVPIAVSSAPSCQHAQSLVSVATQVSRSAQANGIEKE